MKNLLTKIRFVAAITGKLNLRRRFWCWLVFDIIKYPEGQILNLPLKLFYAILFPLRRLHYSIEKKEGYQWESNSWVIHGVRYSDEIFRHFAYGGEETFKIIRREIDGTPIIQRQATNSN